jgi:transposase
LKMLSKSKVAEVVPGSVEGARSAAGSAPGAASEVKRWSANRKKEVVLRLLRDEPVDSISREVSVPIYRLEEWRERALAGVDARVKERENDPLEAKLGEATRRIGELVMEVEILRKERQARHPLGNRRSSK